MAQKMNKYGLKRNIPTHIKREIRKRCGFGCVRCGFGWYDYEHFDPDYCDATEHNPNKMTLLCMSCNQKRNRGILSRESVIEANKNPKCLEEGFANEQFDYGSSPIEVIIGECRFINCQHILCINNEPILTIKNPEEENDTFLLSGKFFNSEGIKIFEIKNNQWFGDINNWDIECVGKKIKIKENESTNTLTIRQEPPHSFIIEKIDMFYKNARIVLDRNILKIMTSDGQKIKTEATLLSTGIVGANIGIDIKDDSIGLFIV